MLLPAHGNLTEAAVRVLEALPSSDEVSELVSKVGCCWKKLTVHCPDLQKYSSARVDMCPAVQRQEALQSPMEQLLHTLPDLKSSPAGSVASMAAGAAQLLPCTDMSSEK